MKRHAAVVLFAVALGAASPSAAADVGRAGVLVNDIPQLDLASHACNVDMYLWLLLYVAAASAVLAFSLT